MKLNLKAARANKNLTQSSAAERIGVTKNTLQNWELGRSYPNALQIRMIEEAYGVKYDDLIFAPKTTL